MKPEYRNRLQTFVSSLELNSEYCVIKPNWVDNMTGNYTNADVLDCFLGGLPANQKKIIIESYTPWRGLQYQPDKGGKELAVDLASGKEFWEFYREMDQKFLQESGIGGLLAKHNVEYLNITNEFWSGRTADPEKIQTLCEEKYGPLEWKGFCCYVPEKLFEIRGKAALISLAKLKEEAANKEIMVSLSLKNLFGLIPHPSRREPFHAEEHTLVSQVLLDICKIYMTLFPKSFWIVEGLTSVVRNYCENNQRIEAPNGLLISGSDPVAVDAKACLALGIDPLQVPHLKQADGLLGQITPS